MRAGDLIVQSVEWPDGRVPEIVQADPLILIADEFLTMIRADELEPGWITADGDVLTFADAFGARYVYRLTGVRDEYGSWYAEWPD